ncbi:MAG: hypothetical protein GXX96_08470 [Planctomycetaceae bacterium]|nr:hypothetical protein [Planctomycetaceae bacterium]
MGFFVWIMSAVVVAAAVGLMNLADTRHREFRICLVVSATIGLAATRMALVSEYHLLWYIPAAIVASFLFMNRDLLALKRQLDRLDGNFRSIEELKQKAEAAVQEHDRRWPDRPIPRPQNGPAQEPGAANGGFHPNFPSAASIINGNRFFLPVEAFERVLEGLNEDDAQQARLELLREGVEAYWNEVNWKAHCRPSFSILCLIPVLWPFLIVRQLLSTHSAQPAIARAVHTYRRRWSRQLEGVEISFEGIPEEEEP